MSLQVVIGAGCTRASFPFHSMAVPSPLLVAAPISACHKASFHSVNTGIRITSVSTGSVSYTHLDVYKRQLVGIARGVDGIALSPAPEAILTGLTPGALEFSARAWTTPHANWIEVRSELAVRIRDGLAEAGIEVPLPQREMHVRSVPGPEVQAVVPGSVVPRQGGIGAELPNT